MKHKRAKNFIKLGILLFGISFIFYACQKDEIQVNPNAKSGEINPFGLINPSDVTTGTLNWNEFKRKTSLDNQSQIFQNFIVGNTNINSGNLQVTTNSDNSDENLIVDDIQMYQYNNLTTYTFVIVENNDNNTFRNLVLQTEDDVEFDAYIALYTPTDEWLNADQDTTPYQGQVNMSPYTGTYQIATNSSTVMDCHFTIESVWLCTEGNNHYPGHEHCRQDPATTILISINITEHCTFGSFGGGTSNTWNPDTNNPNNNSNYNDGNTNTNPDDGQTTTNGNLPLDGVMTKPKKGFNVTTPDCEELAKNEENVTFNQYMQELKNNVSNTSEDAVEKGFNTYYLPEGFDNLPETIETYVSPNNGLVEGTADHVDLPKSLHRKSASHNHLASNSNSLKIYPPVDIAVLGEILDTQQNNTESPLNVEQLAHNLVAEEGIYALKVQDSTSKLIDFAVKYPLKMTDLNGNEVANPNLNPILRAKVDLYYKQEINPSFTKDKQVKGFLNFVAKEDLGVALYEKNGTTGKWEKVYLDDNGVVKRKPCDEL